MSDGTVTWNYTYNADGMRTSRTNGSKTYEYIYNGSQLSRMTISENGTTTTYDFTYDAEGAMVLTVNGYARYIYVKNLQGDIIAILDAERTAIVEYTYDAWGNIISIEGSEKDSLGEANPLRYRGYVYDTETGFYYLQSRYYHPEMGRFINADAYASTGQGVLGNNMFAYCGNNPVIRIDQTGQSWKDLLDAFVQTLQQAKGYFVFSAGVSQLDTALPGPADLVSAGLIVLGIGVCAGIATHNALTAVSTTISKSKTEEKEKVSTATKPSSPTVIYRYGGTNPGNLTPKVKDSLSGLSFSMTPPPLGTPAAVTTIEALNATGKVIAFNDRGNHVCVIPAPHMGTLQDWIRTGSSHPCTEAVKSVVIKWDGGY